MAQYCFPADIYPNGTFLSQISWLASTSGHDWVVTEIGATGRKFWARVDTATSRFMYFGQNVTDFELLLIADLTLAEAGTTNHGYDLWLCPEAGVQTFNYSKVAMKINSSNAITWAPYNGAGSYQVTESINTAPVGLLSTNAFATRLQYINSGATINNRVWGSAVGGIEAAEPSDWNYVASRNTPGLAVPSAPYYQSTTGPTAFTCISIGTGGDSAPYPNPSQTVTTPSGLAVSNIAATTADVDWT